MSEGDREEYPTALVRRAREFTDYMLVEKSVSINTLAAYRRVLTRYLEFLDARGMTEPGAVGRDDVAAFSARLSDPEGFGLSARSTAQSLSAVRSFHRFMVAEGYAISDPTGGLPSPRMPGRLPRALGRSQVEALVNSPVADTALGIRDRFILEFLYATGLRISEMCGLDVGNVDMEERLVTVKGKGEKWRVVPFGTSALEAARVYLADARPELLRGRRTQALVLNFRGGRLTRQGCWKIIKASANTVGLADQVTPHVLRHTFATHLLEGGANLVVVQELLGHASVATTQIYTEVTRDHLRSVYRRAHPRAV